jgi:2-aminoadipate transaminase
MAHSTVDLPSFSLSAKALRTREQPISYLIQVALEHPHIINLAAGLVDMETLPTEETAELVQVILKDTPRGREALQYGSTAGLAPLRQLAVDHMAALDGKKPADLGLSRDSIVITNGSQQGLYLVAESLLDPGDIVIAAEPSYFVYTGTLSSFGVRVIGIPMDDDGMDVDALEATLEWLEAQGLLPRVKLVYCTSYYQNPTGLTLSAERRPRLLEIVKSFSRRHRIAILEDAAYRELRYDGPVQRSIKSYDTDNRFVVLAQTFSKPFAPGVKTGYLAMPHDLRDAALQQKGNHDFGSAHLCQNIVYEAMRSGKYAKHVELLKRAYRDKRDRMLAALDEMIPAEAGITWTRPNGGLYVWLTLPPSVNTSRESALFSQCVDNGVLYVPGEYCCHADEAGKVSSHHIRLSFGQVRPADIAPGIERLAKTICNHMGIAGKNAKSAAALSGSHS